MKNLDAKDRWGRTALHYAAMESNAAMILLLVGKGADVHARDHIRQTPLHLASINFDGEMVPILLEHGAEINTRDKSGDTPLHLACRSGHENAATFLLTQGANIWAENNSQISALTQDHFLGLVSQHKNRWEEMLGEVKNGNLDAIKNPQDIYHLASVMKPSNPKSVSPPKEFIRLLFQQYLPHEPKFNTMYEEIFSQQRINAVEDLQALRQKAGAQGGEVVL